MRVRACLALGSNVGDRRGQLDRAVAALGSTPGVSVRSVSTHHETAPVGGPPRQGTFLNAAAVVETSLAPEPFLAALHAIETDAGRVRDVRWGERTLDLDLILFDDLTLDSDALTIPHPRFAVRRFVLAPLAEVAPDTIDPRTGRSIADLLANLDRRPSYVCLIDPGPGLVRQVTSALSAIGLIPGSRPRRSPEPGDDRWLVGAFWPGLLDDDADPESIRPTFLVANPSEVSTRPHLDGPGIPVIRPDPSTAVAEILAACAATRP